MLNKTMKHELKSKAHALKPVVLMGANGLTPAVIQEIDNALLANELIKVKLTGVAREDKAQTVETICNALDANMVQLIGHVLTLYRYNASIH